MVCFPARADGDLLEKPGTRRAERKIDDRKMTLLAHADSISPFDAKRKMKRSGLEIGGKRCTPSHESASGPVHFGHSSFTPNL
jgi:hypothetical protein